MHLTDLNKKVLAIWNEKVEVFQSAYKVLELLSLKDEHKKIDEKVATLAYLANYVPE